MDETYLIQAAKRGDVESFNVLVLAYQDVAYTVAYRIQPPTPPRKPLSRPIKNCTSFAATVSSPG
jgi:hypothetical protein